PKIIATLFHGLMRLSVPASCEGLSYSSTRMLLFKFSTSVVMQNKMRFPRPALLLLQTLDRGRLALAQCCADFLGEDFQPLAEQVLWDGQRWQQTNNVAVNRSEEHT